MQEFSSISVSSYEAGSLADRLTEQSKEGWEVVAIVPTGSTITAYLSRSSAASAPEAAVVESLPEVEAPAEAAEATPAPAVNIDEPAGWAAGSGAAHVVPDAAPTPEPASSPAAPAAPAVATPTASGGAAPAGWYADPSSRFELRYWDAAQWTEHVSRSGQQYTDPPVA